MPNKSGGLKLEKYSFRKNSITITEPADQVHAKKRSWRCLINYYYYQLYIDTAAGPRRRQNYTAQIRMENNVSDRLHGYHTLKIY